MNGMYVSFKNDIYIYAMNSTTVMRALFFSLILFFTSTTFSLANTTSQEPSTLQGCKNLINKGIKAKDAGNYTLALEYFTQADVLAENYHWEEKLFDIKNNIGVMYVNLSNYGEALGYYLQALEIAKKNPKGDNTLMILNNIANLYSYEKDYKNALEYFKKAYADDYVKTSEVSRTLLAINIGDTYNKMGNYKSARDYLLQVKNSKKSKRFDEYWQVNYAETFFLEGKINEAETMMLTLLKKVGNKNDEDSYVYILELLSRIYSAKNNPLLAIEYAKKGLQNTSKLKGRIDLYNQISNLYAQNHDYTTALHYKDSVIATKDAIAGLINKEFFETTKVKLKVQRYENELKISNEKHSAERTLFIIAIVFTLVLFFFIYRILKNRIVKQKQEKIIAENQQKIFSLELDNLKNNIAEKNRKLSAKALYLSGRNELIEEVINSLSQIPEVSQDKEVSNYMKTLRNYIKTDTEWDDFITYFEKVNPAFLNILKIKHPQLNPADIRFICYIYMNLDIKEISTIFSITSEAGKKRKQRIAKKMEIDADDLHQYILHLT